MFTSIIIFESKVLKEVEFSIHVDSEKFNEKPTTEHIKELSKRIGKTVLKTTAKELADILSNGQTVMLGIMKNGVRKKVNLKSQQVIMLDFDNTAKDGSKLSGESYETISKMFDDNFILNNASFIYKTFNYNIRWERFRVVFILDTALTTNEDVSNLYQKLLERYPTADISCKDSSRVFYGGIESIEVDFNNVLNVGRFISTQPININENTLVNIVNTNQILDWFREKNISALKSYYGNNYAINLNSLNQVLNYLKMIDMQKFFNIQVMPFNDFFHDELKPSSSIFKLDNTEIYLYKCFSESHQFIGDLVYVVKKLCNISHMEAKDLLMEILNIKINVSEKIKVIRDQFDYILTTLISKDLEVVFPSIHTIFWRYKSDIHTIITLFKENIYEDNDGNIRSLTWMSTRSISQQVYGTESKYIKVSQLLNLITYTNFISKLDDSDIPKELLIKIKANQKAKGFSKRSNVYELLPLSEDFFYDLNQSCEFLKQINFSLRSFSKNFIVQNHGEESANKLFLQDIDTKQSEKSKRFEEIVTRTILSVIEQNGYIIEKELYQYLKAEHNYSIDTSKRLYKEILGNILMSYDLKRVALSNALKEKFNIVVAERSRPYILIKNS